MRDRDKCLMERETEIPEDLGKWFVIQHNLSKLCEERKKEGEGEMPGDGQNLWQREKPRRL